MEKCPAFRTVTETITREVLNHDLIKIDRSKPVAEFVYPDGTTKLVAMDNITLFDQWQCAVLHWLEAHILADRAARGTT